METGFKLKNVTGCFWREPLWSDFSSPERTLRTIQRSFRDHDIHTFQAAIDPESPNREFTALKYNDEQTERVLHNNNAKQKVLNTRLDHLHETDSYYSYKEGRWIERKTYCAVTEYNGHRDEIKMVFCNHDGKWLHYDTFNVDR